MQPQRVFRKPTVYGLALIGCGVAVVAAMDLRSKQDASSASGPAANAISRVPDTKALPPSVKADEAAPGITALIERLGDQTLTVAERHGIVDALMSSPDRTTIDNLVGSLDDERVFDPAVKSPQADPFEGPQTREVTVGNECDFRVRGFLFGPALGYGKVLDLKKWWNEHRDLSMDEIKRQAQEAVKPETEAPQR